MTIPHTGLQNAGFNDAAISISQNESVLNGISMALAWKLKRTESISARVTSILIEFALSPCDRTDDTTRLKCSLMVSLTISRRNDDEPRFRRFFSHIFAYPHKDLTRSYKYMYIKLFNRSIIYSILFSFHADVTLIPFFFNCLQFCKIICTTPFFFPRQFLFSINWLSTSKHISMAKLLASHHTLTLASKVIVFEGAVNLFDSHQDPFKNRITPRNVA